MIYRSTNDGWLVISQSAHAWVSGKLTTLWGNEQFVSPMPREAVVLATSLHDIGWMAWDATPRLQQDGRPVNFLETTLADTHDVWERGISAVTQHNLYSGLLVSLHADLVYRRRLERGVDSHEQLAKIQQKLDRLATFQAETQARLQNHSRYEDVIDNIHLQANYRILRTCDLLSLAICTGPLTSGTIADVPAQIPKSRSEIVYRPQDKHTLALNPYPFSKPEVIVQLEVRMLHQHTFSDAKTFHTALQEAAWKVLEFRFVPG